jgi:hypothetical protein
MRMYGFKWSVGALLLGWAVGAGGASIPVFREYSRPIQLYDERGGRTGFDGEAPDRQAWQLLRDTQAREGLMGREAMLGLDFNSGESVFGLMSRAPVVGAQSLPAREDGERRRSRDSTPNRNWLVQSLTLPTLGDKASNTTGTAQSGGKTLDMGWGWLADEVVGAAGGGSDPTATLDWPNGEEGGGWSPDGLNPFTGKSGAASTERVAGIPSQVGPSDGTDSQARERSVGLARDHAGAGSRDGTPQMDFGQANLTPDRPLPAPMSQTREMLADIMVSAKPDRMPWQDAAEQRTARKSPVGSGGRPPASQSVITRTETFSSSGAESSWSSLRSPATGFRGASPTAAGGAASAPRGTWQGGWNASPLRESGLTSYGSRAYPVPVPVAPPVIRSPPLFPANAGTKPGWY